jgi:hypothetical protein
MDQDTVDVQAIKEAAENNSISKSDDDTVATESEDTYYYIIGMKKDDKGSDKVEVQIVFEFDESTVNAALIECTQYNTMTEQERESFELLELEKFAQAYLVSAYKTRAAGLFFCNHKSQGKKTKDQLQEYVSNLSYEFMYGNRIEL